MTIDSGIQEIYCVILTTIPKYNVLAQLVIIQVYFRNNLMIKSLVTLFDHFLIYENLHRLFHEVLFEILIHVIWTILNSVFSS